MPKVSICIPTNKQVDYLRKSLDSILVQDYQDYEIIVTDDSPDDSVKKLVETYDFNSKLKYYKNHSSLGSPENWNEAVRKASGEYIKMLHHDDFFTYDYSLGEFVMMLDKNPGADFAFSAAIAMNVNENKTWVHSATAKQLQNLKDDPRCLFFGNFIGPPSSTIYRNNVNLKYDRQLKWVVDFDFYIQCLLINKSFIFSDKPLITSISGALHNVTNECINNKQVELFEYLHLFNKISKNRFFIEISYFNFFKELFSKYNIVSKEEIRNAGFQKLIPMHLRILLYLRKIKYAVK